MPRSFSLHQDINYTSNWQKKACIFGWIWFVNNLPDCFHYIIVLIATNKQESKIKIAFDHNKIIELNFRLICELQYENSTILQGILQSLRCYYCFPFLFIFFVNFCVFCSAASIGSYRMRPLIHLFWGFGICANLCAIVDVLIIKTFKNIYQF